MIENKDTDQYIGVQRAIASIAYANAEFDESERQVLASSIAERYGFSEESMQTLIEDASGLPAIETIISEISEPKYLRLLFVELMTLAITKEMWDDEELSAVSRAFKAAPWPSESIKKIHTAFELLRDASY